MSGLATSGMQYATGMRAALWTIVLVLGCDRGRPREGAPAPRPPEPPATSAATPADPEPARGCTLAAIPARSGAAKRLVAIGDLHGDLAATRAALRLAGAIDGADH